MEYAGGVALFWPLIPKTFLLTLILLAYLSCCPDPTTGVPRVLFPIGTANNSIFGKCRRPTKRLEVHCTELGAVERRADPQAKDVLCVK